MLLCQGDLYYFFLNNRVLRESLVNDEPILCLVSSCHAHRGLGQLAPPSVPQLHAHQVLEPYNHVKVSLFRLNTVLYTIVGCFVDQDLH